MASNSGRVQQGRYSAPRAVALVGALLLAGCGESAPTLSEPGAVTSSASSGTSPASAEAERPEDGSVDDTEPSLPPGFEPLAVDVDVESFEITPDTAVTEFPVSNYLSMPCSEFIKVDPDSGVVDTGRDIDGGTTPWSSFEDIVDESETIIRATVRAPTAAQVFVPTGLTDEFLRVSGGSSETDFAFNATEIRLEVLDIVRGGEGITDEAIALNFGCWEPGSTALLTEGADVRVFGTLLPAGVGPVVSEQPSFRFAEWMSVGPDGLLEEGVNPFGFNTKAGILEMQHVEDVTSQLRALR